MDHFNNYLECIEKDISLLNEWLGKCLKGFCTIKVISYAISDFKCLPLQYPCMKDIVLLDKYFSFQLVGFFMIQPVCLRLFILKTSCILTTNLGY